jgi:hypothetical protein
MKLYTNIERLRSYSSIFSRSVFSDIMEYDDYSRLNILFNRYDSNKNHKEQTYFDYIKYMYRTIVKGYRCEYVYKNEIISKLLLKEYGTKNTIAINEFRVQNSIVDFALFNGESKAFEIKTEYDSKKRLDRQIQDYTKLFQKCYIVIPEQFQQRYKKCTSENIGIIILFIENNKIKLQEVREAIISKDIDVSVLMRCIRTEEYKNIVLQYFGKLPETSCYEMFEKCQEKIKEIPQEELQMLFLDEIKKRKNNTQLLETYPAEIRQICLSMNLSQKQFVNLMEKLKNTITI